MAIYVLQAKMVSQSAGRSASAAAERKRLAHDFAQGLVERHGVAADVTIHAPGRGGDSRNHHAHILLTTRHLGKD